MKKWSDDTGLKELGKSMVGKKIQSAVLVENGNSCVVRILLDNNVAIDAGVSGNIYDEAYLVFEKV